MDTEFTTMKVAAFTRGSERDYEWKAAWLDFRNGVSDGATRDKLNSYSLKDQIRVLEPGLVLARLENDFGILLTGISTMHWRPAGGLVSASFAFFELNERAAKSFCVCVLKNWESISGNLVSFINRDNSPSANPEWSIEVDGLSNYFKSLIATAPTIDEDLCITRRTRPYSEPVEPQFPEFAEIVMKQKFSAGNGIKVAIGKSYSDSSRENIIENADFTALPNLSRSDDHGGKKKITSELTPSQKLKRLSKSPSSVGRCLDPSAPSRRSCLVHSNKRLLTICGIVAIGIVMIVAYKKKIIEYLTAKPPITNSVLHESNQSKPIMPPTPSEKKEPPQNQNEMAPSGANSDKTSLDKPETIKP